MPAALVYKAFYRHDSGYPTKDFFKALDPAMENIVEEKLDAQLSLSVKLLDI